MLLLLLMMMIGFVVSSRRRFDVCSPPPLLELEFMLHTLARFDLLLLLLSYWCLLSHVCLSYFITALQPIYPPDYPPTCTVKL